MSKKSKKSEVRSQKLREKRPSATSYFPLLTSHFGFTLLEVMVALAIVAITLVIVGSLRNRDILYHGDVRQIIKATLLAQERITVLEMEEVFPNLGEKSGDFEEPYDQFHWAQTIVPTPFDFAREVRVKVGWGSKPYESVEVISYVLEEK